MVHHHREWASSTVSPTEAPPAKSRYSSQQTSSEPHPSHGRSASMNSAFSVLSASSYTSTQGSESVRRLPPLPNTPSSPQHVDTLDDLVAAVGDAIADIGLVDVKDVPPPNVLPPSWESKALPPIIPGTPSFKAVDEIDLQRVNTWGTGQSSLASAVTGSSVTTSSSAVTGSSVVTSTSATQSSTTSPGGVHGREDHHYSKDDRTVDSRTSSERVYDRFRDAPQPGAAALRQHLSTNSPPRTTSSSPLSGSDNAESSKQSVGGANHKRQPSISSVSASGVKRQSIIRRQSSAVSASGFTTTLDFNPFGKELAYQNQSYTRSPEKQRAMQAHATQRPAKSTSPLPPPPPERSKRLKQKAVGWPQAMSFSDVLRMRAALDRAAGYAEKINELAATDSGLEAWIFDVKMQKRGTLGTTHHIDFVTYQKGYRF